MFQVNVDSQDFQIHRDRGLHSRDEFTSQQGIPVGRWNSKFLKRFNNHPYHSNHPDLALRGPTPLPASHVVLDRYSMAGPGVLQLVVRGYLPPPLLFLGYERARFHGVLYHDPGRAGLWDDHHLATRHRGVYPILEMLKLMLKSIKNLFWTVDRRHLLSRLFLLRLLSPLASSNNSFKLTGETEGNDGILPRPAIESTIRVSLVCLLSTFCPHAREKPGPIDHFVFIIQKQPYHGHQPHGRVQPEETYNTNSLFSRLSFME